MALSAVLGEQTFRVGDIVRIHQKIKEEGGKIRIQIFEGMVIAIRGVGINKSFTVRRIGAGRVGIERIFPLHSPLIDRVEVSLRGAVRRAKLYYIRDKTAKEAAEITKRYIRQVESVRVSEQKPKKTASKKVVKTK